MVQYIRDFIVCLYVKHRAHCSKGGLYLKRQNISNNVIRRLPRYLRKLDDCIYNNIDRISSGELGRQLGLTPSQIRQDLSCFGEFGQQGYGYNVKLLHEEISAILGLNRGFRVIIVGVGNLGHALIENFNFIGYGFNLIGIFDVKPELIGTTLEGLCIQDVNSLPEFLNAHHADIAVLTVPKRVANDTANTLVNGGVKALWNFTNVELNISSDQVAIEDIHFSDSLMALSYYLSDLTEST